MSQEIVIQQKANSLRTLLEKAKGQIEMALPKHLTPERLLRIAMTEARKNPALLECTQASFLGAIIQTAQLGLEPGGQLGHAYLVPFKNKDKGITEVQLIVGYRGMIDLMYRSPLVDHVVARPVYDTDKFEYRFGLNEDLTHIPDPLGAGTRLTHVYTIVFLKSGGKLFDVMTVREVEMARARSKSANKGPWVTDYEAMAMKSGVRKFSKFSPLSIELQTAANFDEAGDRGEQDNGAIFETTGAVEEPKSKTQDFLENVSKPASGFATPNEVKKTETPTFNATQDSFDNFKPALVANPPLADEPEPDFNPEQNPDELKDHHTLVLEVIAAAEANKIGITEITAESKKHFGVEPRELTKAQLIEVRNFYLNLKTAPKGKKK